MRCLIGKVGILLRRTALTACTAVLLCFGAGSREAWPQAAKGTTEENAASALTLEQCIGMALASNPHMADPAAHIQEMRGLAWQAGLYPNPRLDSGYPQVIGRSPSSVYSVGLTQEIVRGNKLRLQHAAANEQARQSEWEMMFRRFQVMTSVRQAFFVSLAAQQRQELARQLLETATKSENTANRLIEAGLGTETELRSTRIDRRLAETALKTTNATLIGRMRELAAVVGRPTLHIAAVEGDLNVTLTDFDDASALREVAE